MTFSVDELNAAIDKTCKKAYESGFEAGYMAAMKQEYARLEAIIKSFSYGGNIERSK